MSVLIFQINIGQSTQWDSDISKDSINNIFIPSVQKYAKKFKYDYQLITESTYEKEGGDFQFLSTKEKHYSFERYFHLKQNYDSVVYIDNDIYITNNAEPLPQINGLMNSPEPEGKSSILFRESHKQPTDIKYYNSGVSMLDKKTAEHLQNYMIDRMKNKKRSLGKNSDNMLLNEYILEYPKNFYEISCKWNYMPFLPNSVKLDHINFFHFVGIIGKKLLKNLLDKNIAPDRAVEELVLKLT